MHLNLTRTSWSPSWTIYTAVYMEHFCITLNNKEWKRSVWIFNCYKFVLLATFQYLFLPVAWIWCLFNQNLLAQLVSYRLVGGVVLSGNQHCNIILCKSNQNFLKKILPMCNKPKENIACWQSPDRFYITCSKTYAL